MLEHSLNNGRSNFSWNDIWKRDRYAAPDERLKRAAKRIDAFQIERALSPTKILLDIGCGSGEVLKALAEATEDKARGMFGIDRSICALNLAQTRSAAWPAPGSEDTELGVLMGPEGGHGETEVHARVQA